MNKLILFLIVLSLFAASGECAVRRSIRAAATTGNATQLVNDKAVNITTYCDDGDCPASLYSVELPKVTFRPSSRDVEFMLTLSWVNCVDLDGVVVTCPAFNKTNGLRLVLTNSAGKVFLNFTAFQLGKLSNQHTAHNVQVGQEYTVTITAPVPVPGYILTSYSGIVETLYDTSVPVWVIVVLVAGGLLALLLLVVIIYCLYKKCSHSKDGYESFD